MAARDSFAPFHGSHAGIHIYLGSQALCGILLLRDMWQEGPSVEENAVPPDGTHHRNSSANQFFTQVLHLPDPGVHVVVVDGFVNTDGHRFHVAARHSAVGVKPLEGE